MIFVGVDDVAFPNQVDTGFLAQKLSANTAPLPLSPQQLLEREIRIMTFSAGSLRTDGRAPM